MIRFLVVGGGAAALELSVFLALVHLGVPLVVANLGSFLVGMTSGFLGNRFWAFGGRHKFSWASQLIAYGTLALINSLATSVLIDLFVDHGAAPWLAKCVCMALVAMWNFLLLNRIVFRRQHEEESLPAAS